MTIQWGSYDLGSSPGGTSGMRVGIEVTNTSVSNGSSSVTFTFKVYTQNYLAYTGDSQGLAFGGGGGSGSVSFSNSSATGAVVLRATRTYTYNYPSTSYGSSPGGISFSATSTGAFDGTSASKSIVAPVPARPYAAPARQTGVTLTRNSDTQATLTWSRAATTAAPYTSQTIQYRYWTGSAWSAWMSAATATSTATSYVRTGMSANNIYQFQIRANNTVGSSSFAASNGISMTPAAPSNVVSAVSASGTQITTTWARNHVIPYSPYVTTYTIQRSVNGAAYAALASGITTQSYTDATPGAGTNRYKVLATTTYPPGTSSAYVEGNTVSTIVPPLAPTLLSPNGPVVDLSQPLTFTWQHNPGADGAAQSMFRIQYSANGGTTWQNLVSDVASSVSSYTMPGGTLPNQITPYQWQVKTVGVASASYGPYSATATFTGSSVPTTSLYSAGVSAALRTNYLLNPSIEVDTSYYNSGNGAPTLSRVNTRAFSGTWSLRVLATSTAAEFNAVVNGLVVGQTYTLSAYVYNPSVGGFTDFRVNPSGPSTGNTVTTKDAWVRSTCTFVATGTSHTMFFEAPGGSTIGNNIFVDAFMLEDGDTATAYFDGSTPDTTGSDYAWIGAANNSVSTAAALTGGSGNPTVVAALPLKMSWTYAQANGLLQAAWEAELYAADGVALLESLSGTGRGRTAAFASNLTDGTSYVVRTRVQSTVGLWSAWATSTITVSLPVPAPATIAPEYQPCTGAMALHLEGLAPASSAVNRTNLLLNPGPNLPSGANWASNSAGGSAAISYPTEGESPSGLCAKLSWTVAATTPSAQLRMAAGTGSNGRPIGAGVTAAIMGTFKTSVAGQTWQLRAACYTAAGASISDVVLATISPGGNTTFSLSATHVTPATTAFILPYLNQSAGPNMGVGDWVRGWSALLEVAPAVTTYFDGSTPDISTVVYNWTGAVGASTSTAVGRSEVAAIAAIIERRIGDGEWVTLGQIELPNDFIDTVPLTNGLNEYRATSVSSAPSYNVGPVVEAYGTDGQVRGNCDQWVFVSYGPGFSNILRTRSNLKITSANSRVRASQAFLGRKKPRLAVGQNTNREVGVSATLHWDDFTPVDDECYYDSPPIDWEAMSDEADIVCYRDYTGRRIFGMLSDVNCEEVRWRGWSTVSFSVTEDYYAEAYGEAVG